MKKFKSERGAVPPIVILNLTVMMAVVTSVFISATLVTNTKRVTQKIEDTEQKLETPENEIYNYTSKNNEINNTTSSNINNDLEKEAFNAQFKVYEGDELTAQQVKTLESTIQASNATNTEHNVRYEEPTVNVTKTYNVELEYDDDDYVCEIVVTESRE